MTLRDKALRLHRENHGKIEIRSKVPLSTSDDLSLAYTPGVAEACKEIAKDANMSFEYTARGNLVAVVSDGSAVLGLGDIGPYAAMPVMEGKALLFKHFGDVDAIPLCLGTKDVDRIVETIKLLEPSVGAVNLEDISAPRCFELEDRLKSETSIPIFHDDQHGTAVIVLAAIINALRFVQKRMEDARFVINGAGAAGLATSLLLLKTGATDVVLCDSRGAIYDGRADGMNPAKKSVAKVSNPRKVTGGLADALVGADVLIGLSAPGTINAAMVSCMAPGSVVLAMANPVPEIFPEEAKKGGATVVGTGRSDFPNQVNNVLAFPGILRGALDCRAKDINDEMKIAAARAIAGLVTETELNSDYIIVDPFDNRVAPAVARAVVTAAIETGVARIDADPDQVFERTLKRTSKD